MTARKAEIKKATKKTVAKKPASKKSVTTTLRSLKNDMIADILGKFGSRSRSRSPEPEKKPLNEKEKVVFQAVNGKFGCQNKEVTELVIALAELFGTKTNLAAHFSGSGVLDLKVGDIVINKLDDKLDDNVAAIELITRIDDGDGEIHTMYSCDNGSSLGCDNSFNAKDFNEHYRSATTKELQDYLEQVSVFVVLRIHETVVGK